MKNRDTQSFTMVLTILCGCIAVVSVVLALAESPTWQALTALLLIVMSVVLVVYSLWRLKKDII